MSFSAAILGFAAVAAVLMIIPGLDTTLVLRSAVVGGRPRRRRGASVRACSSGVRRPRWVPPPCRPRPGPLISQ